MKSVKRAKAATQIEPPVEGFNITYEPNECNHSDKECSHVEPVAPATLEESMPKWGSPEWQKFVIGLFYPEELYDGYPKCFGLRRVAREVLGEIVSSRISHMSVIPQVVFDRDGSERSSRAVTIAYELTVEWKMNIPCNVYVNLNEVNLSTLRTFTGVADCIEDVRSVFGRHPAASAETKAESRALKKALGLSILTAEEKISGYDDVDKSTVEPAKTGELINKELKNFIEAKVKTFGISLEQVVGDYAKTANREDLVKLFNESKSSIASFSIDDGRALFAFLNTYQQRK